MTELWKLADDLAIALGECLRQTNLGMSYEDRKAALDRWNNYLQFDEGMVGGPARTCGHWDNVNVAGSCWCTRV